ncbi:MAG: pyridoxal phosphate-dependent aminotransferase family protein [Phycisphaerales bacterium]|nr:MAG: pyridoxal phosphate-dependent aminotransferase family protein [Phycisphaerales bacterium]
MNTTLTKRIAEAGQRVRWAKRVGLYPYLRIAEDAVGPRVRYDGREVLMFGSNDYLGLARDSRVQEKAVEAIRRFGTGRGGAALVCGYTTLHRELEGRLAAFLQREACLLFPSGYQANVGCISALARRGDWVLCDRLSHASIIDGAVLSGARLKRFDHNDPEDLRRLLADTGSCHSVVAVDGVYSMQGDLAPLLELAAVSSEFDAFLIVDDAHGFGVLGRNGRGTAEHLGCERSVDLVTGAMSKALATTGGFAVGDRKVIEYLRHEARAALFSAAAPVANIATALAALAIIEREPERRCRALAMADRFREALRTVGLAVMGQESPIVSILIGDTPKAARLAKRLFESGLFAIPVFAPAVPAGQELIRMHVTAAHTDEDVAQALDIFERCTVVFEAEGEYQREAVLSQP